MRDTGPSSDRGHGRSVVFLPDGGKYGFVRFFLQFSRGGVVAENRTGFYN